MLIMSGIRHKRMNCSFVFPYQAHEQERPPVSDASSVRHDFELEKARSIGRRLGNMMEKHHLLKGNNP